MSCGPTGPLVPGQKRVGKYFEIARENKHSKKTSNFMLESCVTEVNCYRKSIYVVTSFKVIGKC